MAGFRSPKARAWMGAATKAVTSWIHQETGIVVQSSIKSFFASGYQLAVLFAKLGFQVSPSEFSKFNGDIAVNHNFKLLKPVLLSLRIEFNDHTLERVKKKQDGAALWLLHQIMKECKRRAFKREDGETVSDDAFVMLLEVPPQRPMTPQHSDEIIRLPAVTSPTNRRLSPQNGRSSPKARRMSIHTQTIRREELKRGPLSKRHMARSLVRIMLRKLRGPSPSADVHGALPLDPKRLRLMHVLMQTLPAITQGLMHIQMGLDAGSKSTRPVGSGSTSALSLPPVRGAMPNALGLNKARMPNPVNQLAHMLMRHNPRHNGSDKQQFNAAPSGPNGLLYEDCLYQLLRQDRVLSLCSMFRARFPGKCEAIWAKVSGVNGVMPLADVDRASKVILAELWPEADEEDSGHGGDPEGGQEGEQGVRQLQSAWRLAGRKARRRFLADLAAILRSLDINGSDSLDHSEFRVGLMQHLYTQEMCARSQYYGGPDTPLTLHPKPSLEEFLHNIIDRGIRRKLRNSKLNVQQLFRLFDKDKDGCVSKGELISGLNHLGVVMGEESAKHVILNRLLQDMERQSGHGNRGGVPQQIDRATFKKFFKNYLKAGSSLKLKNSLQVVSDKLQREFSHFMAEATKALTVADGLLNTVSGVLAKCNAELLKSRKAVKDGLIHVEVLNRCDLNLKAIAAKEVELHGSSRAIAAKAVSKAGSWPEGASQLTRDGERTSKQRSVPYVVMQLKVEAAANAAVQARLYKKAVQRLVSMAHASVKQMHAMSHAEKMARDLLKKERLKKKNSSALWSKMSDVVKVSTYSHQLQRDKKWAHLVIPDDPDSSDEEHEESISFDWRGPLELFWGKEASEKEAKLRDEAFHVDWKRVKKSKSFKKLMMDWAGGSEVERGYVRDVLRSHYQRLAALYDHYSKFKAGADAPSPFATKLISKSEIENKRSLKRTQSKLAKCYPLTADPEPYAFSSAMFFDMLAKTNIIDKSTCDRRSCGVCFQKCRPEKKVCPAAILQRLRKDCLPRYCFLELFVHLAVVKMSGETDSVREAVDRFLVSELFDSLEVKEPLALRDPRELARAHLEGSRAIVAMEAHKRLLVAIFQLFSSPSSNGLSSDNRDKANAPDDNNRQSGGRSMSLALWLKFCEYTGLLNVFSFSLLSAYQCFHDSLTVIVDEANRFRSSPKLDFKGFLEALVSAALLMRMPNRKQMRARGSSSLLDYLRGNGSARDLKQTSSPPSLQTNDLQDSILVRKLELLLNLVFSAFSDQKGTDTPTLRTITARAPDISSQCEGLY